jgi:hypothetical protein
MDDPSFDLVQPSLQWLVHPKTLGQRCIPQWSGSIRLANQNSFAMTGADKLGSLNPTFRRCHLSQAAALHFAHPSDRHKQQPAPRRGISESPAHDLHHALR